VAHQAMIDQLKIEKTALIADFREAQVIHLLLPCETKS